jgi:hypothetical protein
VGSEALSFGSKAAKAALDPESGVERGGSLGEGQAEDLGVYLT